MEMENCCVQRWISDRCEVKTAQQIKKIKIKIIIGKCDDDKNRTAAVVHMHNSQPTKLTVQPIITFVTDFFLKLGQNTLSPLHTHKAPYKKAQTEEKYLASHCAHCTESSVYFFLGARFFLSLIFCEWKKDMQTAQIIANMKKSEVWFLEASAMTRSSCSMASAGLALLLLIFYSGESYSHLI